MLKFYIYISLLLIIIILLFKCFYLDLYSPKKVKTIALITILVMGLRYAALLILFLVSNIKYLYLLKPLFFMNLIGVPLIILIVLYIFMKGHIINFSYIFITAGVIIALYISMMLKCTCFLQNSSNVGYTMVFAQDTYIYWVYIGINTIALFLSISFINKTYTNRIGISIVILASIATIIEYIVWIAGIILIAENVIGDTLWIIALMYALNRIKKKA
ncbi:membrane protein [Clostridium carboxidivorans P7]|uniref:Uncharacterized protein n=2 Tax=Clostridium TaxID=1485 RepID=C6PZH0_9CLOT|nr:hypothetical protein [Clostridium carboxidivorans]AKN33354.1 membrane protein [Clostridium carboxidivorans P7]EET85359.1 conserved hypothetical protein [Clostridium carboxidivorans P7]EFG89271.1 membrane protein, putative [Clostridium carboxidivorans P7]